jgi:hypothetical protein
VKKDRAIGVTAACAAVIVKQALPRFHFWTALTPAS